MPDKPLSETKRIGLSRKLAMLREHISQAGPIADNACDIVDDLTAHALALETRIAELEAWQPIGTAPGRDRILLRTRAERETVSDLRKLDAFLSEKVMGWKWENRGISGVWRCPDNTWRRGAWSPSSDATASREMLAKVEPGKREQVIAELTLHNCRWSLLWWFTLHNCRSLALAVARAYGWGGKP